MDIKERIIHIVKEGISDDEDREILANSLYYYCCDIDLTPVMAFGNQYKLYVYVDIVFYGSDFFEETERMYRQLEDFGFKKTCYVHNGSRYIKNESKPVIKQSALTGWCKKDEEPFYILYIQGDASTVYRMLYSDKDSTGYGNYIMPKCLCNHLYEILPYRELVVCTNNRDTRDILANVEKRVEYVMGHCFGAKYKKVGDYKYYGRDYTDSGEGLVPLFKRMYYFLY